MENSFEFVLIVLCLYLGIGVVFWLHSLRKFNPSLVTAHFPGLSRPWNMVWALFLSFLLVCLAWPIFCLGD